MITVVCIVSIDSYGIIHQMKNDSAGNDERSTTPSDRTQPVAGDPKGTADRLERVEAALGLLADHLQTSTKGSEILESEHSRSLLSSIAFGFSAIALIAMWSVDLAIEDDESVFVFRQFALNFLHLVERNGDGRWYVTFIKAGCRSGIQQRV